jgi:hypothetical protein
VWDRVEVARTADVHVAVEEVRAYPEGFELRVAVRSRSALPPEGRVLWHDAGTPGARRPSGRPGERSRLGLGFADGTRLTNLSPVPGVVGEPPAAVLVRQDLQVHPFDDEARAQHWWVRGLPPEGSLTVAVEVPALGLPEASVDLDAGAVRAAAERAEVLWVDEPGAGGEVPGPGSADRAVFVPDPRPTGPPPDDEDGARAAIEQAFAELQRLEGDEAVNVEGGSSLGAPLRELHRRYGTAAEGAVHQVERITFVDDRSAAVLFSVWTGPSPLLTSARGDAVLRDGRWLVARATFCGLLQRVGVPCPP